jgi:hypothetical protein
LNKSVFEEFKQWGRLLNVKVLRDWMGRPYGFVQFEASRWGSCAVLNWYVECGGFKESIRRISRDDIERSKYSM